MIWVILAVLVAVVLAIMLGLLVYLTARLGKLERMLYNTRQFAQRARERTMGAVSAASQAVHYMATQEPETGVIATAEDAYRYRDPEVVRDLENPYEIDSDRERGEASADGGVYLETEVFGDGVLEGAPKEPHHHHHQTSHNRAAGECRQLSSAGVDANMMAVASPASTITAPPGTDPSDTRRNAHHHHHHRQPSTCLSRTGGGVAVGDSNRRNVYHQGKLLTNRQRQRLVRMSNKQHQQDLVLQRRKQQQQQMMAHNKQYPTAADRKHRRPPQRLSSETMGKPRRSPPPPPASPRASDSSPNDAAVGTNPRAF